MASYEVLCGDEPVSRAEGTIVEESGDPVEGMMELNPHATRQDIENVFTELFGEGHSLSADIPEQFESF